MKANVPATNSFQANCNSSSIMRSQGMRQVTSRGNSDPSTAWAGTLKTALSFMSPRLQLLHQLYAHAPARTDRGCGGWGVSWGTLRRFVQYSPAIGSAIACICNCSKFILNASDRGISRNHTDDYPHLPVVAACAVVFGQ